MKLIARSLLLGICAVAASATVATTHSAKATVMTSHQVTVSALPMPNCNPSGCQN